MGFKDDFQYGRDTQQELIKKQTEKQKTRQRKYQPNRLFVGLGVAYELLQVDRVRAILKEVLTPILLVIVDDIKSVKNRILHKKIPDEESSIRRWRAKERFADIGKRFKR